ncbi:MAG: hypothetical protein P8M11_15130 [Planctomycetota bacterium]|nr:hypothetical protein [Planctomycetota bacterium]MDG1985888.1 hypothetical protein [Planctomycetota bacterium]
MLALTPLALPLLLSAGGSPQPATSDLLAAIPEDALIAVHVPDPRAIIAARETNAMVGFMLDPEWESIAALFMGESEESVGMLDELKGLRQQAIEAMSDAAGLVAFATTAPETGEDMTVGVIAQGGPKVAAMIEEMFVGASASTLQLSPSLIARVTPAAKGRMARVFATTGNLVVGIESESGEAAARELAARCLSGGAERPGGPFGVPGVAVERRECAVEMAVNLGPIWDSARAEGFNSPMEEQMFEMMVGGTDWMYGYASLGSGENTDSAFVLPYREESDLAGLFANFGSADLSSFRSVPANAHAASAMSLDLEGIFDWAMDLVKADSEVGYEQVMGMIGGITEMSGIDLIEDVLGNMTGQFLAFSAVKADAASTEPNLLDLAMAGNLAGDDVTMIAFVEDTEVLLEAIEFALDMSGMGEMVESGSMEGGEAYSFESWALDPDMGMGSMKIALGAGRLIFSTNSAQLSDYVAGIGAERTSSFGADKKVAAALTQLSGAAVNIQKTGKVLESMASSLKMMGSMFSEMTFADPSSDIDNSVNAMLARMALASDRVVELGRRYFEGTTSGDMVMEQGKMRFRTSSR